MQYSYNLYGVGISSDWPLPCPEASSSEPIISIVIQAGDDCFFSSRVPPEIRLLGSRRVEYNLLEDGSCYLHWRDLFEFIVSADSTTIIGRPLNHSPQLAFQTYLLSNLVSYALLGQGFETLHSASLMIDDHAVGFMGDSAYGKSTLSAAFIQSGHRLLADDILVLQDKVDHFLAFPGFARIKLYERVSKILLGDDAIGTPMNSDHCPKMIYPLGDVTFTRPAPLKALYALASPASAARTTDVSIETLSKREAFIELTRNSFITAVRTPDRIARQFAWATTLADRVPVKRLSYPRRLDIFPALVEAVTKDLRTLS